MSITVIGVRDVEFTTKDGVQISGQNVWYTSDIESKGRGQMADKVFLSDFKRINPAVLPCSADIEFNRYGKVVSIRLF